MDRKESGAKRSEYANERDIGEATATTLPGPTGREHRQGAEPESIAAQDVAQPTGAEPRSTVTGRHDPGSGANETLDGLSGTEEMTRQAAEDIVPHTRYDADRETPVFDRRDRVRNG